MLTCGTLHLRTKVICCVCMRRSLKVSISNVKCFSLQQNATCRTQALLALLKSFLKSGAIQFFVIHLILQLYTLVFTRNSSHILSNVLLHFWCKDRYYCNCLSFRTTPSQVQVFSAVLNKVHIKNGTLLRIRNLFFFLLYERDQKCYIYPKVCRVSGINAGTFVVTETLQIQLHTRRHLLKLQINLISL